MISVNPSPNLHDCVPPALAVERDGTNQDGHGGWGGWREPPFRDGKSLAELPRLDRMGTGSEVRTLVRTAASVFVSSVPNGVPWGVACWLRRNTGRRGIGGFGWFP